MNKLRCDALASFPGQRLAHLSDDEITIVRRRQVGFIFQFYNWLPTLNAAENVALPLRFVKTLRNWWHEFLNYFDDRGTRGFVEGINCGVWIQAAGVEAASWDRQRERAQPPEGFRGLRL